MKAEQRRKPAVTSAQLELDRPARNSWHQRWRSALPGPRRTSKSLPRDPKPLNRRGRLMGAVAGLKLGLAIAREVCQSSIPQSGREGKMRSICVGVCLLLAGSVPGLACSFDTDCEVGSRCLKSPGSIYGICAGGLFPGNSNDRQPVYSPLD